MKLELDINSLQNTPVSADIHTSDAGSSEEVKKSLRSGIKLAKEGSRAEARQMLLSVTKAEPSNETAWLWLASISEYPEELLIFLQNVLKINPDNERANEWAKQTKSLLSKTFVQRGITASQDNQKEFAKQCFLQGIVHDDENEMAWLWLASSSDSQEEKVSHLQRVLYINPTNETALNSLNSVKQQVSQSVLKKASSAAISGDHETARQMLESIMKNTPNLEEAWILKAFLANDFYEKISCYEKTLEINPENEAAQAGLASLKSITPRSKSQNHSNSNPSIQIPVVAEVAAEEPIAEVAVAEEEVVAEQISYEEPQQEAVEAEVELQEVSAEEIEAEHQAMQESFAYFGEESAEEFVEDFTEEVADNESIDLQTQDEVAEEFALQAEAYAEEVQETENYSFTEDAAEEFTEEVEDETVVEVATEETAVEKVEAAFEAETEEVYAESSDYPTQELDEEVALRAKEAFEPVAEEVVEVEENAYQQSAWESEATEDVEAPLAETEEEVSNQQEYTEEEHAANYQLSRIEFAPSEENAEVAEQSFEYASEAEVESEVLQESVQDYQEAYSEIPVPTESFEPAYQASVADQITEEVYVAPQPQVSECPFCEAQNEAQSVICNSCHAMVSLADLEMLLSHQSSKQELILKGIERLEAEKTSRNLNAEELQNLGIAHLNVKNLRQGLAYLQSASQLNPNDVFLGSKVNALATRLAEIEQNEHKVTVGKPTQSRTILVVDDSPTVRKLISGKLEKCGHSVLSAVDGMDALAKINEVIPDLILLDITMPRLDGYQVCKLIRNNEVTKDVPIVMISGKDGFFDKVRGRMAGSSGYITKPFGPDTLMKTIESFLA